MATLTNRSRFVVTVSRRPELTLEFRHDKLAEATSYLKSLKDQKDLQKAHISQGDDHWYVRIRQRGYKTLNFDAGTFENATADAAPLPMQPELRPSVEPGFSSTTQPLTA